MFYNEEKAHTEGLLIKKYSGGLTPEEATELDIILHKNPEAVIIAAYYKKLFEQGTSIKNAQPVEESWNEFQDKFNKSPKKSIIHNIWLYAVAAATVGIILTILVGPYMFHKHKDHQQQPIVLSGSYQTNKITLHLSGGQEIVLDKSDKQSIHTGTTQLLANNKTLDLANTDAKDHRWNTLEVPRKLDYTIVLSDGSTVKLNAASRFKFPLAFDRKREVYLEGEAYFTIAKKENSPFIVHTTSGDINVLGTEFNVNTYTPDILKTALVKGSVNVSNGDKKVNLQPGDLITWGKGAYNISPLDTRTTLSWMQGIYYFNNTPLREIADVMSRWFDVRVVIDNPSLATMTFTGQLDKKLPLDTYLRVMQNIADIKFTYKDNILHVHQ
jgi:hypothetical protein